jgi:hypothetical protein
MALSRRRVLAQEQSADSNADNTEKKPQDETNEGPQSNKEDFVHYLLERPILLLLLDREDVVRSLRNLYIRLRSELVHIK